MIETFDPTGTFSLTQKAKEEECFEFAIADPTLRNLTLTFGRLVSTESYQTHSRIEIAPSRGRNIYFDIPADRLPPGPIGISVLVATLQSGVVYYVLNVSDWGYYFYAMPKNPPRKRGGLYWLTALVSAALIAFFLKDQGEDFSSLFALFFGGYLLFSGSFYLGWRSGDFMSGQVADERHRYIFDMMVSLSFSQFIEKPSVVVSEAKWNSTAAGEKFSDRLNEVCKAIGVDRFSEKLRVEHWDRTGSFPEENALGENKLSPFAT